MAEKLKLGLIGMGGIMRGAHASSWRAHPEVEVVAVCDVISDKARDYADRFGVKQVYADHRELLAKSDVDMVDVCTPNLYHSEIAINALNAGRHVLCEKPDAVNPAEAQKMADAARASGKVLMAIRNNRFTNGSLFLKDHIRAGKVGDLYTGRCGWIRRRGIPGKGGWFTTKALSGGGPLIDLGVHMLDLSMYFMGNPRPVAVSGATYCKFANSDTSDSVHSAFGTKQADGTFDVEDLAIGFIRFENGATLQCEFSWASNIDKEQYFVELRGTKAGFYWRDGGVQLFEEAEGRLTDVSPKVAAQTDEGDVKSWFIPHKRQIFHFVDVIRGRAEPIVRPEDSVHMIKVLSAMYRSAETGAEVRL